MATEKTITNKIRAWLKQCPGVWFFKVHGGVFQTPGIPDLILCVDGFFVALEVKQPGKKATVLQARTILNIREADGIAAVVTSLDQVKVIVKSLLRDSVSLNVQMTS